MTRPLARPAAMSPYVLVDAINCYVSCERVFDYPFRDQRVVVSNHDGCCAAPSGEARPWGAASGA